MRIERAKVDNFGKLNQREFRFGPGINVIYGENEGGKSTLHAFLEGCFMVCPECGEGQPGMMLTADMNLGKILDSTAAGCG